MDWLRFEVFFGITAWSALLAALIFLAGKTRSAKISPALRILYIPALGMAGFAFYWFWAGDGATNLWLVPLVFGIATFGFFRYLKPRWRHAVRSLELSCLLIVLAGYATVWTVVLLYALTGQSLRIE